MSDTIPSRQLVAADVLLYHGTGWLAKAIRFFDGTDVNHAAILLEPDRVGEALGNGLEARTLSVSFAEDEWVIARRLKSQVATMKPVLDRGEAFLAEGHRYAYEQLLLLAFLGLTRKLTPNPALRLLLRSVLDRGAALLEKLVSLGRQPMICSEFVFRCYDEALPDAEDVYTLAINGLARPFIAARASRTAGAALPGKGRGIHPESLLAWSASPASLHWAAGAPTRAAARRRPVDDRELERQIQNYLESARRRAAVAARPRPGESVSDEDLRASVNRFAIAHYQAHARTATRAGRARTKADVSVATAAVTPIQHLSQVAADFVTPGDLLQSDSLATLGRIQLPNPIVAMKPGPVAGSRTNGAVASRPRTTAHRRARRSRS
jgi:hypothetical protein